VYECKPTADSIGTIPVHVLHGKLIAKVPYSNLRPTAGVIKHEFDMMSTLSHPNIIRYVDLCGSVETTSPVLIMEAAHINLFKFLMARLKPTLITLPDYPGQQFEVLGSMIERRLVREILRRIVEGLLAAIVVQEIPASSTTSAAATAATSGSSTPSPPPPPPPPPAAAAAAAASGGSAASGSSGPTPASTKVRSWKHIDAFV
jgi:hypothetical protein